MTKKQVVELIKILKEYYPDAKCSLDFSSPFELLVAVILSAQCTDARVNKTTPALFEKYNKPSDFAKLDISTIEEYIKPCGFHRNKAKNIKSLSVALLNDFNSIVPQNMDDLVKLPGIGRKSANVVMLEAFNNPQGIAIDTHAMRISNRLGLSKNSNPTKIEKDLITVIPKEYFKDVNHLFMWHGRNICKAQNPNCVSCPVKKFCSYNNNSIKQKKKKTI